MPDGVSVVKKRSGVIGFIEREAGAYPLSQGNRHKSAKRSDMATRDAPGPGNIAPV